MTELAHNLRRLMARLGMTAEQVRAATGLNARTIKGILAGHQQPHARTLRRLADGLGVSTDELFQSSSLLAYQLFDRQTNPVVAEVIQDHPSLFAEWTADDYHELYSRFGTGGPLTAEGAIATAQAMNQHRELHDKLAVLLESGQADLVKSLIDVLYSRVAISPAEPRRSASA